jgi:hypothetical protein
MKISGRRRNLKGWWQILRKYDTISLDDIKHEAVDYCTEIKPRTSTTPVTRLQYSILDEDEKRALLWISSKQGS